MTGIRVCFCDLKGRPSDDWDAHEGFCLMLDWAAANGKITPQYFRDRLTGSAAELGITDDEIAAEADGYEASRVSFMELIGQWPQFLRGKYKPPFVRAELPAACYRSEYGFMVHVKDACRCK